MDRTLWRQERRLWNGVQMDTRCQCFHDILKKMMAVSDTNSGRYNRRRLDAAAAGT